MKPRKTPRLVSIPRHDEYVTAAVAIAALEAEGADPGGLEVLRALFCGGKTAPLAADQASRRPPRRAPR